MAEPIPTSSWQDDVTVEVLEQSLVKISGELPFSELASHRLAAIKKLGQNVKVDGFRVGKVPEALLVERLGEMAILTEMAERALADAYPKIVRARDLNVLGYPQIQITKIATNNPLGFTATVAVVPEVVLPNYKAIASAQNQDRASAEVTDEDVTIRVETIMRQRLAYERLQRKATANTNTKTTIINDATTLPTPESEADKAATTADETFDPTTAPLPELTDQYVAGLGQPGQFTTVDDFKAQVREHLKVEKDREVTATHRAKLTDAILDSTQLALPEVLIEGELAQMWAQMKDDIERANLKMSEYLTHVKKTETELKNEWRPAATKRAKLQLILNKIAKTEDITPDPKELEERVSQLLERHKNADKEQVRVYVASVLTNEAVLTMLERL